MSLESDKQIVDGLLKKAQLTVEQAIASFENGDHEKCRHRVKRFMEIFQDADKILGYVQEGHALREHAHATKDDLSQ